MSELETKQKYTTAFYHDGCCSRNHSSVYDDWDSALRCGIAHHNHSGDIRIYNSKNELLVTFHKLLTEEDRTNGLGS